MKRIASILTALTVVGLAVTVVVYATTRAPVKDQGGTAKQVVSTQVQAANQDGTVAVDQEIGLVGEKEQATTTKGHYATYTATHASTATAPKTPTTTATLTSGTQKQTATVTTGAYQDQTATATKVVVANGKVERAGTTSGAYTATGQGLTAIVGSRNGENTDVSAPIQTKITVAGTGLHTDNATTTHSITATTPTSATLTSAGADTHAQPTVVKTLHDHAEGAQVATK